MVALLFGGVSTIVATVLVTAAVAVALDRIDERHRPGALGAYEGIVPRLHSLGWAWLRIVVAAGLLTITVIGIPPRGRLPRAGRVEPLDHAAAKPGGRQPARAPRVRNHGLVNVTAFPLGPILGVLILFFTSSSLALINLISSLAYVAVMPYVGIALALLFYDLRSRVGGPVRHDLHSMSSGTPLAPDGGE